MSFEPEVDAVQEALRAGMTRFMGVALRVAPGALVPRAETELLGRTAVEHLGRIGEGHSRVIDMCCGSGNLGCAVACLVPGARVWACDVTEECVAVARANVEQLRLGERVEVFQGDLFSPLQGRGLEGTVDCVVCNPPYISTGRLARDRAELLAREPREAFDGGPYGLSIHQRVIRDAVPFLRPDGVLMFEFGLGQERQLAALLSRSGSYEDIQWKADEAAQPRAVVAKKKAA